MKKIILKITGIVAITLTMVYNVKSIDEKRNFDISLVSLGNEALAQSEGGNGDWGLETYNSSYSEYTDSQGCTWRYYTYDCMLVNNPTGCEPGFVVTTKCN